MIVYADVLIFFNLIINYFLLVTTAKILRKNPKTLRLILGAFFGAISSLYIFLPQSPFGFEILFKILISSVMCLITFGFMGIKAYLKCVGVLFCVTFGFGGVMYAVWLLFSPNGMVINNSVVYFDISLIALIAFTVAGYIIFSLCFKIFSKASPFAESCDITLFADNKSVDISAVVDTGNSIEDVFSSGEIIIADRRIAQTLFGCDNFQSNKSTESRYRLLPCNTVSGRDVLEGVRCDRAEVKYQNSTMVLQKPILAISKTAMPDGNDAIINPKILR